MVNNGDREERLEVMKCHWASTDGSGRTEEVEIAPETTLEQLVEIRLGGDAGDKYNLRVNGQAADESRELYEGDRISVVPKKYDGFVG